MRNKNLQKLILASMFLAVAIVLPFVTAQNPDLGNMLLPMHLPVLLCGLVCGWYYGLAVGIIAPLFRSLVVGAPVFFPRAVIMACELGAYGLVIGLIYCLFRKQDVFKVYISLISAMLVGRIVKGIVQFAILGLNEKIFYAFVSGAFTEAIPGMILQLILIPAIMITFDKTKLVPFKKKGALK